MIVINVPSQSFKHIVASFKLLSSTNIWALLPEFILTLTVFVTCLKKNNLPSSKTVLNCVSGSNPIAVPVILSAANLPSDSLPLSPLSSSTLTSSISSSKSCKKSTSKKLISNVENSKSSVVSANTSASMALASNPSKSKSPESPFNCSCCYLVVA